MEVICYTKYLLAGEKCTLSFLDIFLNDTWAEGEIQYPEALCAEIGGKNTVLLQKQDYEFLLRAARNYSIKAIGTGTEKDSYTLQEDTWEAFREDCYITGKYQRELLDTGCFNSVIESLLQRAAMLKERGDGIAWLEKMIGRAPEYYTIDDNTQPILIYKTSDIAFNLLNIFAEELARSLISLGQKVEVFDVQKEGTKALTGFIGRRFKAVVGIQSYVFGIRMLDDDILLHDLITGPKYNMILDHPAFMKETFSDAPRDYHLLLHDRNYLAYVDRYFTNIGRSYYFAPAGIMPDELYTGEKIFNISFIGKYYDYRERLRAIKGYSRINRFFAARYMRIMRKNPNLTAEAAFQKTMDYYGLQVSDEKFCDSFHEFRQASYCIMLYYREKVIRTLLEGGVCIDVFGDTWKKSPFIGHENFIYHPSVHVEDSLKVMQSSRISLNIMSWHKDGFTERAAHALLCHSILLSDKSTYLKESFINGEELVLFDLEKLEELPGLVKELLSDHARLEQIAERGYQKACQKHLWKHRGEKLISIIEGNEQ